MKYATLLGLAIVAVSITAAHAKTFNYACKSGEDRYALTVNTDRGIVKLQVHGPPFTLTTFRILKVAGECGKYSWALKNGAMFCTATQGVGTLEMARKHIRLRPSQYRVTMYARTKPSPASIRSGVTPLSGPGALPMRHTRFRLRHLHERSEFGPCRVFPRCPRHDWHQRI